VKIRPNPNSTDTTSALTIAFEPGRLDLKIIEMHPTSLLPHPRRFSIAKVDSLIVRLAPVRMGIRRTR
jgi:hypothetical protein